MSFRVGQGFDIHGFEAGKPMKLGGLTIPCEFGLKGHSDGDVVLHALCDALLGAAGLGDIGEHFPDTDPQFQDYDSQKFLQAVLEKCRQLNFQIANVDITIIAQIPRINPYKPELHQNLAKLLDTDPGNLNLKATTTEQMGFIGREEGMAAMAVVLLQAKQ